MSSRNSFLAKYSKSNSHNQESQKINQSLEWLNKEYNDLCFYFLSSVGIKEFLSQGFTPKINNNDTGKVILTIPVILYACYLQSLEHIKNLESKNSLNEGEKNTLNKYKVFLSIFEEEIQDATRICHNKIVTINKGGFFDIDEALNKIIIELLNEVEIGNKVEFYYPDETDELFRSLILVLAILKIYHNKNIVIFGKILLDFFPEFISILKSGTFNGFLDFPYLVGKIFPEIIDTINDGLGLDIAIENFEVLSQEEIAECMDLYKHALIKKAEEGKIGLLNDFDEISSFYEDHGELILLAKQPVVEQTTPKSDSKASAAILKFFDSNSNTLVAKLKESGLQLSAAALQNDQNIARVANVVYNLLPGMVRIFVSYDTVENFLLNNRQWLINKLV